MMRRVLGPSMLRNRHRNAPRPAWKVADAFRQWLRGRPCACAGKNPNCGGPIRSAHVDYAGTKGIGTKVDDRFCIPLSDYFNKTQHAIGWHTFETRYLNGPGSGLMLSNEYWAAWPGRSRWESELEARNG